MKKVLLSVILLHASLNCLWSENQRQNDNKANIVTGVAGINFGESESVAKSKLKARFGDFTADNNSITFINPTVGDVLYDYAVFYFKYNQSTKQKELVAASLSKHFYTWNYEDAKMFYNSVTSRYASKYTNELDLSKNDNLLKLYGSITEDYSMPPITISLSKGVSRGGESYYYVTVKYASSTLSTSDYSLNFYTAYDESTKTLSGATSTPTITYM